jgi:SpoVK/Ycf46/Vps4 family AAA+-type ATPase
MLHSLEASWVAGGLVAMQVVFLDEVDALCPRRTDTGPHEARIAAQLLALLDGAAGSKGGRRGNSDGRT